VDPRVKGWDKKTIEEGTIEDAPKELTDCCAYYTWGKK
jgi:hypothetical protein